MTALSPRFSRLRTWAFGIDPSAASFAVRGFRRGAPEAQKRLERAGRTFLDGYHAALDTPSPNTLADRLDRVDVAWQGFAYEGAAMGLALLDGLLPGRRLDAFLDGPGAAHVYMVHVGAGWAMARLPIGRTRRFERLDPLLRWLAVDGYGFHEGYFRPAQTLHDRIRPRGLSGYARRAFDQGVGRSLWFVEGASVGAIVDRIAAFPAERRGDLWSGVGLACAYAGGATESDCRVLRGHCGPHRPALAQGAAFAAQARRRAGSLRVAPAAARACQVLCALSPQAAADVTDRTLADLSTSGPVPAYEVWRQRIQRHFRTHLSIDAASSAPSSEARPTASSIVFDRA